MSLLWSVLAAVGAVLLLLLKVVGILLLIVLVLLAVLLLCPFCADVAWEKGVLTIRAGALGMTFPVFRYPQPESRPKKKNPKQKAEPKEPKRETPPRQKAKLTLNILCTILRGAGRLTRAVIGSLRFTHIRIRLGVRGDDPADAARTYGKLNAWLYTALGVLDRLMYLDFEQLQLLPDFGTPEPTVQDSVSFRVSARLYAVVFTALRVLYEFWREKVLDVFL